MRRHGFLGSVRAAIERLRDRLLLLESHVWLQMRIDGDRPRPQLPDGFRLQRMAPGEIGIVDELGPINPSEAARRQAAGADLWGVLDERGNPAFSCWIFTGQLPVLAAENGSLALRDRTAAIEDSCTAAEFRGHNLGPACGAAVVDRIAEEGIHTLITKIADGNQPARKAASKIGFEEIATMRTTRLFWSKPKVDVSVIGDGEGPFLGRQLTGRLAAPGPPGRDAGRPCTGGTGSTEDAAWRFRGAQYFTFATASLIFWRIRSPSSWPSLPR